ncbi:MAG: orotate phosphoribosyltransferase [bacterium]|nr:orotate phosphoribosyltransferase [bacterium]
MGRKETMNAADYARLLKEIGAVELRTDPKQWFTWASGKRSPIYCDNRILMSCLEERRIIASALAEAVRTRFPDVQVLAGTATAGIPHAAWVAEILDLPMVYVRGSAKEHGKQKQVEGRPLSGERVVVIEDLVSLGGSAISAIEALQREGGKVIGLQAIFTYGFAAADEKFEKIGVPWQTITSYEALLSTLDIDEATSKILLDWRDQ